MSLKAIDFFCGAGGMTYGLSQAGISVLAGIDCDPMCRETYEINNPQTLFLETDIKELSERKLARLTGIRKRDKTLVFACCSPCQYWSKINTLKCKSIETKNLLSEFERFVSYFSPGFILIENVPGLLHKKHEGVLSGFLDFLSAESYCFDHGIINANRYAVPQNRYRYVLIAGRYVDSISLPPESDNRNLNVRDFIGTHNGFPEISDGHRDDSNFIHSSAFLSERNRKRIELTKKDGGNRLCWKDKEDLQIDAYRGKDNYFIDVYGRMYWDRPAPTITTRFNSFSNGRFGHPEENRAMSLREGASLQTFPKSYVFKGPNQATIARQIGNAVPPSMAEIFGNHISEVATNG